MATHTIGIIMNGVTGRMGLNQHLRRSIYAIMQQGGVRVGDEAIMPKPPPARCKKARRLVGTEPGPLGPGQRSAAAFVGVLIIGNSIDIDEFVYIEQGSAQLAQRRLAQKLPPELLLTLRRPSA